MKSGYTAPTNDGTFEATYGGRQLNEISPVTVGEKPFGVSPVVVVKS